VAAYEQAVQQTLEHAEVDALIAIFACVGDCDPNTVGRGIRRGVLRAERNTGVSKPALLCLMGAAGAIKFGVEGRGGETGSRHVFPSYRFPESAALALSRAVQYAAFRSQPGGRLTWFEGIDSSAARQEIKAMLDTGTEDILWLEKERAWKILQHFGIQMGVSDELPASQDAERATIEVRTDPSFGPLIRVLREGKPPLVRITPLTDHDVREIVEVAAIPTECGVEELLGRVSQLIEELPWLCSMQAEIHRTQRDRDHCGVVIGSDVRIGFCR